MMERAPTRRRAPWRARALSTALAALLVAPSVGSAQVDDSKDEADVQAFEVAPEEERDSLLDEARQGPEATNQFDSEMIDIETLERTEAAMTRLVRLVENTPAGDPTRAEAMFRLAELYYERARFYEQRAYTRRDEAAVVAEENPARARAYRDAADDDLRQSDEYAERAIALYGDIIRDYEDTYDDIDAVLFYLGANLSQLGYNEEAREIFDALVGQHPRSRFVPQALLALGEYEFLAGNMADAYRYYDRVTEFPQSSSYAYALYKKAWTIYNMAETDEDFFEALELLLEVIEISSEGGSASRLRLRGDALRDLALFYMEILPADRAYEFFREVAPDDAFDLLARLARLYGDKGEYEESNTLYRDLIELNQESFDIVEYQREIVRNTRPSGEPVDLVREVRRLVELFDVARTFADAEPREVQQMRAELEVLVRSLATTYHREAQTTRNEELYALAYNLYQDYVRLFPDSEHIYTMWFYYGELLYRNQDWEAAAMAYDNALAESRGEEGRYDQEATLARCLAFTKTVDLERTTAGASDTTPVTEDDLPPIPEAEPIPSGYQRLIDGCNVYLETNPDPERAVEILYVIAYLLYDYNHLDQAVRRFAQIATDYASVDPERAKVSAELLLDSLYLQRRYTEMTEWIQRFMNSSLYRGEFATRLNLLSEQVRFKACRDLQEAGDAREAGHCFIEFVETHYESTLVDKALYNAGLAFEEVDELDFAISAYQYLTELRPDSELVPETVWELGRTYHRLAIYDEAASFYERYARENRDGEHVEDALINASQFRQGLGDYEAAIDDLELYIDVTDDRQAAAEARFQIAMTRLEQGQTSEAVDALEAFTRRSADSLPSRALEAFTKLGTIQLERGREERATRWFEDSVNFHADLDVETRAELSPAALDAVAQAQFQLGERVFERFSAIELSGSADQVRERTAEKVELGRQANAEYEKVFNYGRPGWAIAAFTRLGELYHVFYRQLIDAPVPDGLDPLVAEEYRTELETQAAAQKEDAMSRYLRALEIARNSGWFNEYSERAAQKLQELDPTFKSGSEVRIDPGYDQVDYYRSPFIVSLDGDEEGDAETPVVDDVVPDDAPEPSAAPRDVPAEPAGEPQSSTSP